MSALTDIFDSIADAIRAKNGSSDTYTPAQMASAIENIPSGGGGGSQLKIRSTIPKPKVCGKQFTLRPFTNERFDFNPMYIWTDGENIYYSYSSSRQYVLDKSTWTWVDKTWNGTSSIMGCNIWTDGTNIYHSANANSQYVLNKETDTWETKTWTGLTNFSALDLWTDGDYIYYTKLRLTYVLDVENSSWSIKHNGNPQFANGSAGKYFWTDGDNIYYSNSSDHYILDKTNWTWTAVTWTGCPTYFGGVNIWSDGTDVYMSIGAAKPNGGNYVLNKGTYSWSSADDLGDPFYANTLWTDGENIYKVIGNYSDYNYMLTQKQRNPQL